MVTRIDYDPLHPVSVSERQNAFERYLNVEKEFMAAPGYASSKEATLRKIAIRVIFKNSQWGNYDAFVPYLALIYFDRFISHNPLPNEILDLREEVVLIANTCLKIAYGMRDGSFRPLDFLRRTGMLGHEVVRVRVELAVLHGLDWKTRAVTAVCFVNMFVGMSPAVRRINQKTLDEIVIQAQGDIEFTKFRPSVIAAGAILSACLLKNNGDDLYNNCCNFLLGLRFAYEEELKSCMRMATKLCISKRIAIEEDEQRADPGSSSGAGGASSSGTGGEPLKETTSDNTEVDVETQQKHEEEPVKETSERKDTEVDVETQQKHNEEPLKGTSERTDTEVELETQQKHDEEPLKETSERTDTEVDPETQPKHDEAPMEETSERTQTEVDPETQQKHDREPVQVRGIQHKPGRKQLPEIEETEDETEIRHRPGKEPAPEIPKGEAETEIRHRPGKEPIPELTKAESETKIQHRPGKEPVPDTRKAEAETESPHRSGKESVPEILPVRRSEYLEPMKIELKWLMWEACTGEETIDCSLFRPRLLSTEPKDDKPPNTAPAPNVAAPCCPLL